MSSTFLICFHVQIKCSHGNMAKRKRERDEDFWKCIGLSVSDSNIRKIVSRIKGLPEPSSSERTLAKRFPELQHCVVEHSEIQDGVLLYTVDLCKYLRCVFSAAPHIEAFLEKQLAQAQRGKLGVTGVLYADEAVPGNVLSPDLTRKSWCIYFSYLPLCRFRNEKLWWPLACVRHDVADNLPGKVAQLISFVLQSSLPFLRGQVIGSTLIHTNRLIFLADEDGLKQSLSGKGASGLRPCLKCSNCLAKDKDAPGYHTIEEAKFRRFVPYEDETVRDIFQHLSNLKDHATQSKLEEHEKLSGWKHNDHVYLKSDELWGLLKPSQIHYDVMHNYWSNGVCGQEISFFYKAITEKIGVQRADLVSFLGLKWKKSNEIGAATSSATLQSLVKDKLLKARFCFFDCCISWQCFVLFQ